MIAKKRKQKVRKLSFGTYPYTAIRSLAMRSLLLQPDDYVRMRKMGINEILRFLAEGQYKKEISQLSEKFRGRELVNLALNLNLSNSVRKLLRISIHDEVKEMFRVYSNKWIARNLKLVMRVKMNRLAEENIRYGVVPLEPTTMEFCIALYRQSPAEIKDELKKIDFIDSAGFAESYEKGLAELENYIDVQYYSSLYAASRNISSRKIREFIENYVTLTNIRNIVKLKAAGISREKIEKVVVGAKTRMVSRLLDAENIHKIREVLDDSPYSALSEGIEKDLAVLENNIEKFLLQYSSRLLHSKLTSIPAIFGYLVAKEMEVRNLRLLVNSIDSRIGEQFVSENLIIPA